MVAELAMSRQNELISWDTNVEVSALSPMSKQIAKINKKEPEKGK